MALSIDEVLAIIEVEQQKPNSNSVSQARHARLELIRDFLRAHGFPRTLRERFEFSLHPLYFQEVNYDDLNPYSKNGDLGHLKNVYDIDLAVQTGGLTRELISDTDFADYLREQARAMDWRKGRSTLRDRLLLSISRMRGKLSD